MRSNQIQVGGPNDCPPATTTISSSEYDYPKETPSVSEKGWECPRCGRINAPWIRQCDCSAKWEIMYNTDTPDWWKDYVKAAQADCVGGSDYFNPNGVFWSNVSKIVSNIKEIY